LAFHPEKPTGTGKRNTVYTSDGNRLRTIENQLGEQPKMAWAMLIVGLSAGFIGLYVFLARPMSQELRTLRVELAGMHARLERLTAQGEQVWETNSLLSALNTQHPQLDGARKALQSLRTLRSEVETECDRARLCVDQVRAMSRLNDCIIAEQPSVEIAGRVIDDMTRLTDRLSDRSASLTKAEITLDEMEQLESDLCAHAAQMEQAQDAVRKMVDLNEQLANASGDLDVAWFRLHALATLKHSLMDGAQYVEIAQAISDQLLAMQQQLAEQGGGAELAMNRARSLLELSQVLTREELNLPQSRDNLQALLHMQQKLTEFPSLAESLESLDLLLDFQNEFIDQIQSLGTMRKSLMEIALMETTLAKAVHVLHPLLELGNLRHLSDAELRSAARNVLDERTRLSGRPETKARLGDAAYQDAFVPMPAAE